jgi:hypothetical protein
VKKYTEPSHGNLVWTEASVHQRTAKINGENFSINAQLGMRYGFSQLCECQFVGVHAQSDGQLGEDYSGLLKFIL